MKILVTVSKRSMKSQSSGPTPSQQVIDGLSDLSSIEILHLSEGEVEEMIEVLTTAKPKHKEANKYIKLLQNRLDNPPEKAVISVDFTKPISYARQNLEGYLGSLLHSAKQKGVKSFKLDSTFQKYGAHPPLIQDMLATYPDFKKFGYRVTIVPNTKGTMVVTSITK